MTNTRLKCKFLLTRSFLILLISVCFGNAYAQDVSLIPVPVNVERGEGNFVLTEQTRIHVPKKQEEVSKIAAYLADKIKPATGYALNIDEGSGDKGIELILTSKADARIGKEGYVLEVTPEKIAIKANEPAGLFYGVQTLLQLLPEAIESKATVSDVAWHIPSVSVTDYPRFRWRGIMLDVSRHFFSKDYVKEYIDQIARFKFNRLHLHLTDDNGWRVEIKSLPKLTQVGAWRVPREGGTFGRHAAPKPGEAATDGGFYTQEDIKEIVQYAKSRYIEILPEVDIPGHSMAALAAYPELCVTQDTSIRVNPGSSFSTWYGNGKFKMHIDNTLNPTDEKVYQFLDKVFTEIAAMFPYEYIHIGGDECYKGYWENDPGVQAFMKKHKIKDGVELQSYFTKRVAEIVASKKKKAIGWDEILEGGIAPSAAVMSWRGSKGGIEASQLKHFVVMSPAPKYYLDMMQGDRSIEPPVYSTARLKEVYDFSILPEGIDSAYVLGGQGNLWTEQVPTEPQVEYMTYPRALAIAETMWSPKPKKDWNSFVNRVENQFERFDLEEVNYATSMYDPIITVKKNEDGLLVVDLETEVPGLDIYYTIDNTIPNQYYNKYKAPIVIPEGTDMLRLVSYKGKTKMGRLISVKFEDLQKRVKK